MFDREVTATLQGENIKPQHLGERDTPFLESTRNFESQNGALSSQNPRFRLPLTAGLRAAKASALGHVHCGENPTGCSTMPVLPQPPGPEQSSIGPSCPLPRPAFPGLRASVPASAVLSNLEAEWRVWPQGISGTSHQVTVG